VSEFKEKLEALLLFQSKVTENQSALELAGWEPEDNDLALYSKLDKAKQDFLEEFDIWTPPTGMGNK
jgi:hypothetical protein